MASAPSFKDAYLTDLSFNDARQFMDEFFDYYSRGTLIDFIGTGVRRVVFRGVDDARFDNLPRSFRSGLDWSRFDFYAPPPLNVTGGDKARGNYLFDHRQVELRAVFNFLNYSDKLGIPTPLNFYHLDQEMHKALKIEKDTSFEFSSRAPHINHPFPGEDVREAFALAQHNGVPTRLLDWTESAEIAMFFAADASWKDILADAIGYRNRKRTKKRQYIAVYGLGCRLIDKLNLSLVNATRYQNPRLRAQAGVSVLDLYSDVYFMSEGSWLSLEDRVRQLEDKERSIGFRGLSPEARLVKWNLAASESNALAKLLLERNVSLETMFPSLENPALAFGYRQKVLPRS